MNERERVLDLVKKGVLSTEEALDLLEGLAKEKGEKHIQKANEEVIAEKKDAVDRLLEDPEDKDFAQDIQDQEAEDKKTLDSLLDDLATEANRTSVELDEVNVELAGVASQLAEAQSKLMELNTKEELDILSDEELAERKELEAELTNTYGGFEEGFAVNPRDTFAENSKQITGGFFFLGILFGMTFTIATGMIIYYKQISEGLDDQERFAILQKVGMSHREVKSVIHGQVLMVFAFPLLVAILHLAFAFPIIRNLLVLFGLVNWQLFLVTTVVVVALFALLYFLIYQITAKSYYQIVERE